MKIEDAKIGQLVVGNDKANRYSVTGPNSICRIIDIFENILFVIPYTPDTCDLCPYCVDPDCFDIYETAQQFKTDHYQNFEITEKMMRDLLKCPEGKAIYIKEDDDSPYTIREDGVYDKDECPYDFVKFIYIMEDEEYKIDDIPCVEMTLEEVCKALGKNIKIIKGETK